MFRTSRTLILLVASLVAAGGACQNAESKLSGDIGSGSAGMTPGSGSGSGKTNPHKPTVPDIDLDSKDILARPPSGASPVYVKHVLIGWQDLAAAYRGKIDPRAAKRTNADAAKLAKDVLAKLKAAPDTIDAVIKESGEDPGSMGGTPYKVTEKVNLMPDFKKLALRLQENEAGIVKTPYGYHVMVRVGKPPLDPIESADILNRTKKFDLVDVQHILIGWKEAPAAKDPRAKERTKEAAGKLAQEILAKVKAGGDMVKLMKENSEDPGSKDSGKPYPVSEDEQLVDSFKELAMHLEVGEAGIVKSDFGYHVMKRIPADPIQSNDILARTVAPEDQKPGAVKIKYILLGWKDAHIDDKRGTERDRAAVDKLVKDTMARLAKKDTKFEDVMKELSEDKQTGGTGMGITADIPGLPSSMKLLGQRLKLDEVGVVKTQFGMFIIKRVADTKPTSPPTPPPPAGSGSGSGAMKPLKPLKPAPGSAAPAGSAAPHP